LFIPIPNRVSPVQTQFIPKASGSKTPAFD
jgi:hypothetical protein